MDQPVAMVSGRKPRISETVPYGAMKRSKRVLQVDLCMVMQKLVKNTTETASVTVKQLD